MVISDDKQIIMCMKENKLKMSNNVNRPVARIFRRGFTKLRVVAGDEYKPSFGQKQKMKIQSADKSR